MFGTKTTGDIDGSRSPSQGTDASDEVETEGVSHTNDEKKNQTDIDRTTEMEDNADLDKDAQDGDDELGSEGERDYDMDSGDETSNGGTVADETEVNLLESDTEDSDSESMLTTTGMPDTSHITAGEGQSTQVQTLNQIPTSTSLATSVRLCDLCAIHTR